MSMHTWSKLTYNQWRAEVWWCHGRLLDWMPPTQGRI